MLALAGYAANPAMAQSAASAPAGPPTLQRALPDRPLVVPRIAGRLTAAEIGLVINTADPYSVTVGRHYRQQRKLTADQVLEVELPLRPALTADEFEALRSRIEAHFGKRTQALALAWSQPYAVLCNSITGALALGLDSALCQQSCARSRLSPVFNSASTAPWRDHGLRLSMLLAAPDVDSARALIDRGVAADASLGRRGGLPVQASFLTTDDAARNVRAVQYPASGNVGRLAVRVQVEPAASFEPRSRLLLLQTGQAVVDTRALQGRWVAGALADHLTSYGGQLEGGQGQTTALDWIAAGATASYGTVSEPCSHAQKFPHPQVLLLNYLQGSSAIEAYWKSVAWPQQGVFVGEPLAAPFAASATLKR